MRGVDRRSAQPPGPFVRTGSQPGFVSSTYTSPAAGCVDCNSSVPASQHQDAGNLGGDRSNTATQVGEAVSIQSQPGRTRKRTKSQRHRDAWVNDRASIELKRKYRAFLKGYKKFNQQCVATDEEVFKEVQRRGREVDDHHYSLPHDMLSENRTRTASATEQREMAQLIDMLKMEGWDTCQRRNPEVGFE